MSIKYCLSRCNKIVRLQKIPGVKKMPIDKKLVKLAKVNLDHLCDIQILQGLSGLLPLLRSIHSLMQFTQARDLFVCDYVVAIQVCMAEISAFYVEESSAFTQDNFWDFKALCEVRRDAIPMAWIPSALDLNSEGLKNLHFIPTGHMVQVLYKDIDSGASSLVTRSLYVDIVNDVKLLCKGEFNPSWNFLLHVS
jgi:hypothetical protein